MTLIRGKLSRVLASKSLSQASETAVDYSHSAKSSAPKELQAISGKLTPARLIEKIKLMTIQPRPLGPEKLAGRPNLYRVRQGNYWFAYSVDDEMRVVDIVKVGHRRNVYRWVDLLSISNSNPRALMCHQRPNCKPSRPLSIGPIVLQTFITKALHLSGQGGLTFARTRPLNPDLQKSKIG